MPALRRLFTEQEGSVPHAPMTLGRDPTPGRNSASLARKKRSSENLQFLEKYFKGLYAQSEFNYC